MNSKFYIEKIEKYLSEYVTRVKLQNNTGSFDINKEAERLFIPPLNIIFNSNFIRTETIKANYPGIDLICSDDKIAFQITSETRFSKIKRTLEKVIPERHPRKTDMYFLILDDQWKPDKIEERIIKIIKEEVDKLPKNNDPKFLEFSSDNIWNLSQLIAKIKELNYEEIKSIYDYFSFEFDDFHDEHHGFIPFESLFNTDMSITYPKLNNEFWGREKEMENIKNYILESDKQILNITGRRLIGKTRIVFETYKKYFINNDKFRFFELEQSKINIAKIDSLCSLGTNVIVFIDDVNRYPYELSVLNNFVLKHKNIKLIYTSVPTSNNKFNTGIQTHKKIDSIPLTLLEFDYSHTVEIIKSYFPNGPEIEIRKIAQQTMGVSGYISKILDRLRNHTEGNSNLLEQDMFKQIMEEDISELTESIFKKSSIEKNKVKNAIFAISLFEPLKAQAKEQLDGVANFAGVKIQEFKKICRYLSKEDFLKEGQELEIRSELTSNILRTQAYEYFFEELKEIDEELGSNLIINLFKIYEYDDIQPFLAGLLAKFRLSFQNRNLSDYNELRFFLDDLNVLMQIAYLEPNFTLNQLIIKLKSEQTNEDFWSHDIYDSWGGEYYDIHQRILNILTIASINLINFSDQNLLYNFILYYSDLRKDANIFNIVYKYRIYDFRAYGYNQHNDCSRQLFLIQKLDERTNNEELTPELVKHSCVVCKMLLETQFQGEDYFDTQTDTFLWSKYKVVPSSTIIKIRKSSLNVLMKIANNTALPSESSMCIQELSNFLFQLGRSDKKTIDKHIHEESLMIIQFLKSIIAQSPTTLKATILYNLRALKEMKIELDIEQKIDGLISIAISGNPPLENLLLGIYAINPKNRNDANFVQIISNYESDDIFIGDVYKLVANDHEITRTLNFKKFLIFLTEHFQTKSKVLFMYVLNNNPEIIHNFCLLIKVFHKQNKEFYETINRIWNIGSDDARNTVIWMLTSGRNNNKEILQGTDLRYFEEIIDSKNLNLIYRTGLDLIKYVPVAPERTLELIETILGMVDEYNYISSYIITLFENSKLLKTYKNQLKEFSFKLAQTKMSASPIIGIIISFLNNYFDFGVVINFITILGENLQKENLSFPYESRPIFYNPKKDNSQRELDYLEAIKWYIKISNPQKDIHQRILAELKPKTLESIDFYNGFKRLIGEVENKNKISDAFSAINILGYKTEQMLVFQIDLIEDLKKKYTFNDSEIIELLGEDYIYNFHPGIRLRPAGSIPSSDLRKEELIKKILAKKKLSLQTKCILELSIKNLEESKERFRDLAVGNIW